MSEEWMKKHCLEEYVCNTYRTTENRENKITLEGGSRKGCENVMNKELVVYSYEQRRMEATFKGVVEPMIMMIQVFIFEN
jgi:hypothetical protein